MRQRIVYYLAAAAVLAAGIAGAVSSNHSHPALATGLEIISGNDRAMMATPGNQVLAGVNSTKLGTEIAY